MNDIFVYPLQNSKEYKDIINCINNKGSLLINGLLAVQKPHIAYSMYRDLNRQTIFITNSDLEAKKVYDDLSFYMKDKVEYIGFQDILFYHKSIIFIKKSFFQLYFNTWILLGYI